MLPDRSLWLAGILCMLLHVCSCTMREPGCLDPNANNFDLDADRSCDDCCTYPVVSLVLTQKWDTLNFDITDTFFDRNDKPFLIHDLRYFLTAWSWQAASGQTYRVDSIETICISAPFIFYPDIVIIEPQRFSYTLGIIRTNPIIDSIDFMLGLAEDLSCLDPDNTLTPKAVTSDSPLWNPGDSMLHSIRLILNRNPVDSLLDTLYLDLHQTFELPFPYTIQKGKNTSLPLTVNYEPWFREADVDDVGSWLLSIANGLQGSIYQTP